MSSPCPLENLRNHADAGRSARLALSVLVCIIALAFAKDAGAAAAPVITSPTTASGVVGAVLSYQINATNAPTGYGATGLPSGLSVNTTTGLISGTPSATGVSTVTLSAMNSGGTGTAALTITITAGGAGPVVSHTIQISNDADDGYYNNQDGSGWHLDPQYGGADLVGSWSGTTEAWVPGYRFPSTGVNSGDTIQSAYLQLVSSGGNATSATCGSAPCPSSSYTYRIYGVAQDDGPSFTGATGNSPVSVPYTAAYTDYTSIGPGDDHGSCQGNNSGQNTCTHIIDVTNIVKEITSRPGWTSTSAMRFVMLSTDATAPNVYAGYADYSANPSKAATLVVNPPLPTIVSSGAWGTEAGSDLATYSTGPFVYPGASTLLLFLGDYYTFYGVNIPQPSVTDSCGNTWNILAAPTDWVGFNYFMRSTVYYVQNPAPCPAGDTITITVDTQEPIFVHFLAVKGSDTTQAPVVSAITSPSPGTYTTSASSNSITLTNAGLLVSWIFGDSSAPHTFTPQTGFMTDLNSMPGYLTAVFESVSSPGSYQSQFSISPSDGWQTVIIGVPAVVAAPPVITSSGTANATAGGAFSYQITATNAPGSFGASGLPAGLTVNAASGLISGTPTGPGTFNATVSATNSAGTVSAPLTLTVVLAAPVITSSGTASGAVGTAFSYQITAANLPSTFGASGLPAGLMVNSASGLISGTPSATGVSMVTLSAANGDGTSTATLTLSIMGAPVITSAATASGVAGTAFSYQITGSNTPTGFGATGLPGGLSVNATTGLISGTPTGPGAFNVTVSASNIAGTGTATLTLTIVAAPAITSADTANGVVGTAFSYQITASNTPTGFGASGLPAGLSVNTTSGLISGTPTGPGAFNVSVSATNSTGTGNATLTLTVVAPPVITSTATASGEVGAAFSYQITATNTPTGYGATGLPSGLSVNTSTGLISGTPAGAATASVTLNATNSAGTGSTTLTLTITVVAPVITSAATASGTETNSFSYQITAMNAPSSYGATGLPSGLSVNTTTGLISGTPSATGVSTVTLSAMNSGGTGTAALTITITAGGAGPVVSHTIQISNDADDGYYNNQDGSGWHLDPQYGGADLVGSWSGTTEAWVPGYRFPSTGVNSGDTIQSAYLQLVSSGGNATSATCGSAPCPSSSYTYRIYGVAQDDGPSFTGATGNSPVSVPYTAAYTDYTSTGPGDVTGSCQGNNSGQNTCTHIIDVTSIVKEITSRPGWTSTSAMRFVMLSTDATAPNVYAGYADYSANPSKAATLVVNPPLPTIVSSGAWGTGASGSYPTTYATGPFVYPGASTLLLFLGDYYNWFNGVPNSQPSVSDSCGNTWSILAGPTDWAGFYYFMRSTVYYVQNPAPCPAGDTITITVDGTQDPIFTHFLAVKGSDTTQAPVVSAITSPSPGTYTTSASSNSITLTNAGLLVSWIFGDSDAPHIFTPQGGFTTDLNSTPNYLTAALESVSSPGSYQSQFSISPSDGWQTVIIGVPAVVAAPPVITSSGTANATAGGAFSYQITATNAPGSFGASGLPAGLTVNAASGLISGTPTGPGTFNATVSATNSAGTVSAPLTLTVVLAAPVITSSGTASGAVGTAFSYQITAANLPSTFGASGLPAGLMVNSASGLISGTPSATGVSMVTLSAANGDGTSTATLTLSIMGAPVITSAATASGVAGTAFSYQITGSNTPTGFGATGLPGGLSVNATTGLISGTPTGPGAFNVTVSASNIAGTGTATLTLTIVAAPAITSADTANGVVGTAFSYQITASNTPTGFGASGLPAGLSVNTTSGLISGTPTGPGAFNVSVSATNSTGTGNATLTLTVVAPPVITSTATASGEVGAAFSYQITATNTPTGYGATGLPSGLSVNTSTGLISGTPAGAATASVTLNATNSAGTGSTTLTLTITVVAPVITSAATASGTETNSFSYQITAMNAPSSYGATGLPSGLSVNTTTGLISGTPSATGVSTVTLSAMNSGGTGTAALTITITAGGAGPVVSHTIQISNDADDGYYNNQDGSGWHLDPQYGGADLVGSWSGTTEAWVPGYRFPSTGVNSGDTIQSAYLQLVSSGGNATSATCGSAPCPSSSYTYRIYGVAQDDGPSFTGATGNSPVSVPYTAAYTDYTSIGPGDDHGSCQGNNSGQNTCTHIIDVTNIVKEITSRPGWTSTSAMRFVMLSTDATAPNVYAGYADYSANPSKAATLVVNPPLPTIVSSGAWGTEAGSDLATYSTGPFVYPGASTLLLFLGDYYTFYGVNIPQPSVTDSCGNTWNILAAPTDWVGFNYFMRSTVYYVQNPAPCPAGDTITITVDTQEPIFVHFLAVKGSDTTQAPVVSAITSPSPGTYTTSASSNSITLTNAGLLVSWIFGDSSAPHTFTPQTGFMTDLNSMPGYLTAVFESVSSPGSYQSQFSISPSDGWQTVIIGVPAVSSQ